MNFDYESDLLTRSMLIFLNCHVSVGRDKLIEPRFIESNDHTSSTLNFSCVKTA